MNRTRAAERVDGLLGEIRRAYLDGRCPRCEALFLEPFANRRPAPGEICHVSVWHESWCAFPGYYAEVRRLIARHGFRLAPVVLRAQPSVAAVVFERAGSV